MILKEDLEPRGRWKLGRIKKLIEGSVDGVHRAAVIRTSLGRKLNRPYRMIYSLELTGTVDKLHLSQIVLMILILDPLTQRKVWKEEVLGQLLKLPGERLLHTYVHQNLTLMNSG